MLQKRQTREYYFQREKVRELFEEVLEQDVLTLLEIKRPDEVGHADHLKYCPYQSFR